jgi:DNA-binding CsgD family transcriptional regulator
MSSIQIDPMTRRGEQAGSELRSMDDFTVIDTTVVELRQGPGVLLLSRDGRPLHMNQRGEELLKFMNGTKLTPHGAMPLPIIQVCKQLRDVMQTQVGSKDCEHLEVCRIAGNGQNQVLLRGFGLPGGGKAQQARILILMETIAQRENPAEQAKERFQLTTREQSVVENLTKGWTNKEIASALGITEPTVKAHIKHIMEKTKCTTRTGILAQVLNA